jgi:hypothetical protein
MHRGGERTTFQSGCRPHQQLSCAYSWRGAVAKGGYPPSLDYPVDPANKARARVLQWANRQAVPLLGLVSAVSHVASEAPPRYLAGDIHWSEAERRQLPRLCVNT